MISWCFYTESAFSFSNRKSKNKHFQNTMKPMLITSTSPTFRRDLGHWEHLRLRHAKTNYLKFTQELHNNPHLRPLFKISAGVLHKKASLSHTHIRTHTQCSAHNKARDPESFWKISQLFHTFVFKQIHLSSRPSLWNINTGGWRHQAEFAMINKSREGKCYHKKKGIIHPFFKLNWCQEVSD